MVQELAAGKWRPTCRSAQVGRVLPLVVTCVTFKNEVQDKMNACDCSSLAMHRQFHPHQKGDYSVWNMKTLARARNHGSRVDFVLAGGPGALEVRICCYAIQCV